MISTNWPGSSTRCRLFVGGSSAGARLAILFALRHPRERCAACCCGVSPAAQHAVDRLAENYYGKFIKIARAGGMAAVCESEHFAECINARPYNRERLTRTDRRRVHQGDGALARMLPAVGDAADRGGDRGAAPRHRGPGVPDRRQRRGPYPGHRPEGCCVSSRTASCTTTWSRSAPTTICVQDWDPQGMAQRGAADGGDLFRIPQAHRCRRRQPLELQRHVCHSRSTRKELRHEAATPPRRHRS